MSKQTEQLLLLESNATLFPQDLGVAHLEHIASLPNDEVVKYLPRISPQQYKLLLTLYVRWLNDPS